MSGVLVSIMIVVLLVETFYGKRTSLFNANSNS